MNVVVVDEFPVLREGIRAVLSSEPDLSVVADVSTPEEVLCDGEHALADVVVLGLRRDEPESVEAGRALLERYPELRVLVLMSFPCASVLRAVVAMEPAGIVIKESERQVLRDAVRAVGAGSSYMDESVEVFAASLGLGGARHRHGLSSGEFEAIRLLPEGLSNRAIAESLGISASAVKWRLSAAMGKLGVRNRSQASAWALRTTLRAHGGEPTARRANRDAVPADPARELPEIRFTGSGQKG
ncbi:MAG: LuxR C-terminal-related transcriptional regulator [Acidimicrobiales bacterium]